MSSVGTQTTFKEVIKKYRIKMEVENIYYTSLNEKDTESIFDVGSGDEMSLQKLLINSIYLGSEAKDGEFNVVEIEIQQADGEVLKIPIAVLKAGETRSLKPSVEFKEQTVKFRLVEGTGPVHILGRHIFYELEMEDNEDGLLEQLSEEDDDEYVHEEPTKPQTNGKAKRKK